MRSGRCSSTRTRCPSTCWARTVETTWEVGAPITWSGEYEGKAYEDHGTVLAGDVRAQVLSTTHFSPLTGKEDVPENYHTVTYHASSGERRGRPA